MEDDKTNTAAVTATESQRIKTTRLNTSQSDTGFRREQSGH